MSTQPQGALPLPEFEHIPFGSLAETVRSLDIQQVEQLIGYERNHGQRILVLELLEHRRDELRNGAEPEPAVDPPPPGEPTNPAQPR